MLRGKAMQQHNSSSQGAALRVHAAGGSDIGRVRPQNEDAIVLCQPQDQTVLARFGWLYLLADGAGGHAAGEIASRLAVETIAATYYAQATPQHVTETTFSAQGRVSHLHGPLADLTEPIIQLQHAFVAAHTHIREAARLKPEYTGMITTCIAAVVKGSHLLIAHVGDSRAYLIRPSPASLPSITRLTNDHSMVTELVRAGIISPDQLHSSPSRHIILRALGGKEQNSPIPDITTGIAQAGDHLLLCCDGLWSMLTEEQIALVVSNNTPQRACDELIRLANEARGEDNISAVVLSFV
jgi:serine/threonine protein phosphatase PrpC